MRLSPKAAVVALGCALALAVPCAAFAANSPSATTTGKDAAAAEKPAEAGAAQDSESAEGADKVGPSEELAAWAQDRDCAACHEVPAASVDDEECPAFLHAAFEFGCIDCHADDALIEIHDTAKADAKIPTRLKKSAVSFDLCATCHPHDVLVEKTTKSTVLTDSEGTVVNPHDVPDVKDHRKIACTSCHTMHVASKPAAKAPTLCTDCHHEDVYECYTCHS